MKLFSKNKDELIEKIELILGESTVEQIYIDALTNWLKWFKNNEHLIKLEELNNDSFYRAYYLEPDVFGIQMWKSDGELYVWDRNVYMNKDNELNDCATTKIDN